MFGDTVRIHGPMNERPRFETAILWSAAHVGPCSFWQALRMVIP